MSTTSHTIDNPDEKKDLLEQPKRQNTDITGRFDKYRSSYWPAAIAVLSMRYGFRFFMRNEWESGQDLSYFQKHKYAGVTGLLMQGVAGVYAWHTWKDMRSVFSQSLAWEFDKDPEKVSFRDFRKSKNTIIHQTTDNFIKFTFRRFAVNSAFFLPFIAPLDKIRGGKYNNPESAVDAGVAINGAYLASDVFLRKPTPFEELQSLIDRKLNHADHFAEKIDWKDLFDVYERHAQKGPIVSFASQQGTHRFERSAMLFERMADLMNQTYKLTVPNEPANFELSHFIHLVGNGMIHPEKLDQSCALIEIANRYGIPEVSKTVQDIKNGVTLESVLQKYGINLVTAESKDNVPALTEPELPSVPKSPNFVEQAGKDNIPEPSIAARVTKKQAEQRMSDNGREF